MKALTSAMQMVETAVTPQAHGRRKHHQPWFKCALKRLSDADQTQAAKRDRPRLRRVRITRRPVCERMRTRKPETRLRFRLVPPKVRLVMDLPRLPAFHQ